MIRIISALVLLSSSATTVVACPENEAHKEPIGRYAARNPSGAFSADGHQFAYYLGKEQGISGAKASIQLWDVPSGKRLADRTIALRPSELPEQVLYNASGQLLVLLCQSKVVALNENGGRREHHFASLLNCDTQHRTPPILIGNGPLALSPSAKLLASGDKIWDVSTAKKLTTVSFPSERLWLFEIRFSPDGAFLAYEFGLGLSGDWSLVCVVETKSGNKVLQIGEINLEKERLSRVFDPRFSLDGKAILTTTKGVERPAITVRDIATRKQIYSVPRDIFASLLGMSPDQTSVVSWVQTKQIVLLTDLKTGQQERAYQIGKGINDIVYSAKHGKLALIRDDQVKFLDVLKK